MNPEELFARQLCHVLDHGAAELDPTVAERLRAMREHAIQRQPLTSVAAIGVGHHHAALSWDDGTQHHPFRTMLSIIALLLGVILVYYWNDFDQATVNEEIDSELLADDLPPNAYLDKGFHAWLEKSALASQ